MADRYTALATAQNSGLVASRADGNNLTANVVWAKGSFTTATGVPAAAEVLKIALLPKGAVVIPGLCFIDTEVCGTGVSITIGDNDASASATRYSTAISLSTAGRIAFTGGAAGPNPYSLTTQCWIQGVLTDAGSYGVTPDRDFTVWIAYVLP